MKGSLLEVHQVSHFGHQDMVHQRQCEKVARIFNVSQEFVFQHLTAEGRFNMLKAGVDYLLEYQDLDRMSWMGLICWCDSLDVDFATSCKSTNVVLFTPLLLSCLFVGTIHKNYVKLRW